MDDSASPEAKPEPPPPAAPPPAVARPPGQTSPWVWVSLAMSTVALLATVVLPLALMALAFGAFAGLGPFDDSGDDYPGYYVDQGSVIDAVEDPCEDMTDAAENVRLGGPRDEAAASLHKWAGVAQRVVTAINGAHPNQDSRQWRDDWSSTIKAVNAYADNLGKAGNQLKLPDVESMYYETDAECGVPAAIAGLDPQWASYMLGE